MKLTIWISLIMSLSCFSCNKRNCPAYFQIPAIIQPALKEYHVGDTITIVSAFHKEVLGLNERYEEVGTYDMTGIKWQPITFIRRIDTVGLGDDAPTDEYVTFHYNPNYDYDISYYSDNTSTIDGEYLFEHDSFKLEVKMSFKKPGTFFLRHNSRISSLLSDNQHFKGDCEDGFSVWIRMNGNSDNNIDLLQESPDEIWQRVYSSQSKDQFYDVGGYCYKVLP